jgi:hypothetical protein
VIFSDSKVEILENFYVIKKDLIENGLFEELCDVKCVGALIEQVMDTNDDLKGYSKEFDFKTVQKWVSANVKGMESGFSNFQMERTKPSLTRRWNITTKG